MHLRVPWSCGACINIMRGYNNVPLHNAFSSLLLAKDGCALYVVRKVFEAYGVELATVTTARELDEQLRRNRVDLVVVDYDVPGAGQVACLDPSIRWNGFVIALHGAQSMTMRGKRIHLVVPKPLTVDLMSRGMKALYTTMARHKLLTYRHPVTLKMLFPSMVYHGVQRPVERATVVNLSQTGLCFAAASTLPPGAIVSANLPLPESRISVNISGTIMWSDASGRAGLQFGQLSTFERKKLQDHLNSQLPWRLLATPA
jgi:CheY-like chemotaxis protein